MQELKHLFEKNAGWVRKKRKEDPRFFHDLAEIQTPRYLWIGCSDSRIPASGILDLQPGEIFVHRNIANLFPHTDFNCLSVLQYAVEVLGVEHVIICGHYGCGGISAAMETRQFGLVDNWLRHVRDIYSREKKVLESIDSWEGRCRRLVEFNVLHQVMNVCHTTIVQNAWGSGRKLSVHGWVYDLETGLLRDLNCCISSLGQVEDSYRTLDLH